MSNYPFIQRESAMEAYIYDHVRTPRGKGDPDGALHEITSVEIASQLLQAIKERNSLDIRRCSTT